MSHAADRALEHYGLRLNTQKLIKIRKRILACDPTVIDLGPRRDGARFMAILFKDTWLAAIVASDSFVVTFLPTRVLGKHEDAILERELELMRLECEGVASP